MLGTWEEFEGMNLFMEEKGVRPIVDERVLDLGR